MPRWRFFLRQWFWRGVDLLYPPRCAHCGRLGDRLCPSCQRAIAPLSPPLCPWCGYRQPAREDCPACQARATLARAGDVPTRPGPGPGWFFDRARAWAWYQGPVASAIRALKYRRDYGLGEALARWMLPWVRALHWQPDCFVPMPLAPKRYAARGYNQVTLVARPLADALDWPYCPDALQREDRPSQVGRDWLARWRNMRDAFRAARARVAGRKVVMTTGATLDAASRALRLAGARSVFVFTIARVPKLAPSLRPRPGQLGRAGVSPWPARTAAHPPRAVAPSSTQAFLTPLKEDSR